VLEALRADESSLLEAGAFLRIKLKLKFSRGIDAGWADHRIDRLGLEEQMREVRERLARSPSAAKRPRLEVWSVPTPQPSKPDMRALTDTVRMVTPDALRQPSLGWYCGPVLHRSVSCTDQCDTGVCLSVPWLLVCAPCASQLFRLRLDIGSVWHSIKALRVAYEA
jgi:hypothetical protein